jgi:hypothetical protein
MDALLRGGQRIVLPVGGSGISSLRRRNSPRSSGRTACQTERSTVTLVDAEIDCETIVVIRKPNEDQRNAQPLVFSLTEGLSILGADP